MARSTAPLPPRHLVVPEACRGQFQKPRIIVPACQSERERGDTNNLGLCALCVLLPLQGNQYLYCAAVPVSSRAGLVAPHRPLSRRPHPLSSSFLQRLGCRHRRS